MLDGTVVFRTREGSALSEDLRTGIADAEYKVAFEIYPGHRTPHPASGATSRILSPAGR
jgi:hypothetical protein